MHSIKNISERNKIDTQSRADAYIRRKRLISKISIPETAKTLKPSLLGKQTPRNPKKPKKPKKKKKNPLGWVFFKNPGFFQPWLSGLK